MILVTWIMRWTHGVMGIPFLKMPIFLSLSMHYIKWLLTNDWVNSFLQIRFKKPVLELSICVTRLFNSFFDLMEIKKLKFIFLKSVDYFTTIYNNVSFNFLSYGLGLSNILALGSKQYQNHLFSIFGSAIVYTANVIVGNRYGWFFQERKKFFSIVPTEKEILRKGSKDGSCIYFKER